MNLDWQVDGKAKWLAMIKDKNMKGIQLREENQDADFLNKFDVSTIPRFILIDTQGRILDRDAKKPSDRKLREELDALPELHLEKK